MFLYSDINIFLQKRKNWKIQILINFVASQKVFEQQRCTISNLKALDQLFWPLAWSFTLGVITVELCSKMSVRIILIYPLFVWKTKYLLKHLHSTQYRLSTFTPQQSLPSKSQASLLFISSQNPSFIHSDLPPSKN